MAVPLAALSPVHATFFRPGELVVLADQTNAGPLPRTNLIGNINQVLTANGLHAFDEPARDVQVTRGGNTRTLVHLYVDGRRAGAPPTVAEVHTDTDVNSVTSSMQSVVSALALLNDTRGFVQPAAPTLNVIARSPNWLGMAFG